MNNFENLLTGPGKYRRKSVLTKVITEDTPIDFSGISSVNIETYTLSYQEQVGKIYIQIDLPYNVGDGPLLIKNYDNIQFINENIGLDETISVIDTFGFGSSTVRIEIDTTKTQTEIETLIDDANEILVNEIVHGINIPVYFDYPPNFSVNTNTGAAVAPQTLSTLLSVEKNNIIINKAALDLISNDYYKFLIF